MKPVKEPLVRINAVYYRNNPIMTCASPSIPPNVSTLMGCTLRSMATRYYNITKAQCALVCCLGTSISKPGVIAKATGALAGKSINIMAMSQSLSQINIQFVINRENYREAIISLNDTLCYQ
jgi:aspartate kinase